MHTTLRLRTTVLPGHRIEVAAPELPEGASVELLVMYPASEGDVTLLPVADAEEIQSAMEALAQYETEIGPVTLQPANIDWSGSKILHASHE